MDAQEIGKEAAAKAALDEVKDGMVIGIGSGTTSERFILALGERVQAGLKVAGVPTSHESAMLAGEAGIPLIEMPDTGVDLAIDGADVIAANGNVIKGRGGALVREKLVAWSAHKFVLIVDASKFRDHLYGTVPVEVLPFGANRTLLDLTTATGVEFIVRTTIEEARYISDNGNFIADGVFQDITEPDELGRIFEKQPGIQGHGLFLHMHPTIIVGNVDGTVRRIEP